MANNDGPQRESTLDSTGPWAVWIGIGILMVLSVGLMLNNSIGIQDGAPPSAAAGPPADVDH